MHISTNTNDIHGMGEGFLRRRAASALLAMAMTATAVGFAATSCADEGPAAPLQPLMPTPANTQLTVGPAVIPDDGIHMHFWVNGSAPEVLAAYKTALEHKGWAVTVVSSEGWQGAGNATYTATRGMTYGVQRRRQRQPNRPPGLRVAVKAREPQLRWWQPRLAALEILLTKTPRATSWWRGDYLRPN